MIHGSSAWLRQEPFRLGHGRDQGQETEPHQHFDEAAPPSFQEFASHRALWTPCTQRSRLLAPEGEKLRPETTHTQTNFVLGLSRSAANE
eukprot:CAMPEP_0204375348 /NCGR_PEP_ID=MMETSP0469-20131031/49162_1 /ASSEMBLY_ACC=CAM_ASM_000384 /TAXON_ID=2969 /ORGANISM="Oxyrrhis marina" /LENGTH=89 /DNA_ID=CAMNT_0051366019 /DNA_START=549 /DNA_END=818 /DNA_ORIENTATION=-